jgi:hypothetical protein
MILPRKDRIFFKLKTMDFSYFHSSVLIISLITKILV